MLISILRKALRPMALNLVFALLLAILFTSAASAQSAHTRVQTEQTSVTVLSDVRAARPGEPFLIGFLFEMIPDWHIYWENPGDSGLPPMLEYDTHPGVKLGYFLWPPPEAIPVGPLMNFGYSGTVLLPFEVKIPSDFQGDTFEVALRLDWLICKEDCLPQEGEFVLNLPVQDVAVASEQRELFEAAVAKVPPKLEQQGLISAQNSSLIAHFPLENPSEVTSLYFFPRSAALIEPTAAQHFSADDTGLTVAFEKNSSFSSLPESSSGLLEVQMRSGASTFYDVTLEATDVAIAPPIADPVSMYTAAQSLVVTLILAFLGGIILNLMPCVFPVISIKVLSFVNKAKSGAGTVREHALIFSAGIVISMLALGVLILFIKGAGTEVGWGFQLQSPAFVALLALLFFALSLSFLGYFEFGHSIARAAGKAETGSGRSGSFLSGVLTTAVATPCTGPFLGVALGFALSQSALVSMLIFGAVGMGIAFPYIVLAFVPRLLHLLPRPGEWMETLKQFLAFPLLLTAFYLLWVLAQQSASAGILLTLGSMLMFFTAIWLRKRFVGARPSGVLRGAASLLSIVLMALSVLNVFLIREQGGEHLASDSVRWQQFTPELAQSLATEGHIVYVDFTAAWCITCQVNKRVVFSSQRVLRFIEEHNVQLVQADWTNRDPMIRDALASFGRAGVPFNLIYSPLSPDDPVALPALLTPGIVLAELRRALGESDDELAAQM